MPHAAAGSACIVGFMASFALPQLQLPVGCYTAQAHGFAGQLECISFSYICASFFFKSQLQFKAKVPNAIEMENNSVNQTG